MKKLNIFIHSASDLLTDHESHGEGLICFSILNGLALRGHKIWAYTPKSEIRSKSENLKVFESSGPTFFSSLSPWKYGLEANKKFDELSKSVKFDLVWRMNPIGYYCPVVPKTSGTPLISGPIYYFWKNQKQAKSRFFFTLRKVLNPFGIYGWQRTLKKSKAVICATYNHAVKMKKDFNLSQSFDLPLIIDPSNEAEVKKNEGKIKIVFLANLLTHKRPLFFCQIIKELIHNNLDVEGIIIGDGPLKNSILEFIEKNKLSESIKLLGKLPNTNVRSILANSQVFINTADGEPYGRNIVEAMSEGCVVISHNSGGPSDFLKDGITGILVKGESSADFAIEIANILKENVKFEKISKNAINQSLEWTSEKILNNLEKELYNLLQ